MTIDMSNGWGMGPVASALHKATKECWAQEKESSPGKSARIAYLIPNGQPCKLIYTEHYTGWEGWGLKGGKRRRGNDGIIISKNKRNNWKIESSHRHFLTPLWSAIRDWNATKWIYTKGIVALSALQVSVFLFRKGCSPVISIPALSRPMWARCLVTAPQLAGCQWHLSVDTSLWFWGSLTPETTLILLSRIYPCFVLSS